jgi:hypothetical protein
MDLSLSERSSISLLPVEILSEIFYIHVNVNHGSRWSLLLTSRTWYHVVTNLGSLWNNLYLGDGIPPEKPPEMFCCIHLDHLMAAIRRAGSSCFNLCVAVPCRALREGKDESFSALIESGWLVRCRSLDLITISPSLSGWEPTFKPSSRPERIDNLFASQSFPNLEHLSIQHRYVNTSWERVLGCIMRRVEETTKRLNSLRLLANNPADRCGIDLVEYPRTLRHLRSLIIENVEEAIPWILMGRVEKLLIRGRSWMGIPGQYIGIPASLRDLSIENSPFLNHIPTTICENLTRLTIVIAHQIWDYPTDSIRLPNLFSLALCSYRGNLSNFDIPRLHELTIQCYGFQYQSNFYPSFQGAIIRPRVLNLAHNQGNDAMEAFLESRELWHGVEELHLITLAGRNRLSVKLKEALTWIVTSHTLPILRILTVLHPNHYSLPIRNEEKKIKTQQLREIAHERAVTEGLRPLEAVSIGWYRAPTIATLRDPSRAQWRIEWRDCV